MEPTPMTKYMLLHLIARGIHPLLDSICSLEFDHTMNCRSNLLYKIRLLSFANPQLR